MAQPPTSTGMNTRSKARSTVGTELPAATASASAGPQVQDDPFGTFDDFSVPAAPKPTKVCCKQGSIFRYDSHIRCTFQRAVDMSFDMFSDLSPQEKQSVVLFPQVCRDSISLCYSDCGHFRKGLQRLLQTFQRQRSVQTTSLFQHVLQPRYVQFPLIYL